ncbi:MAG TPA: PAS domain-containing protein [Steroidobacteraceae bacterium]|nr:PAS domain-containing protein [Steroidobacteraceae bacterium]
MTRTLEGRTHTGARTPAARPSGELLAFTQGFADAVAALLFPYAEVVVHDLHTQRIAYIANNLSRRKVGDDSALERARFAPQQAAIGPYEKRNWDGAVMRSVSVIVRSARGTAIGMVCINLNIGVFEQARAALDLLVSGARLTPQPKVIFQDDWQERINTFVHAWLGEHQAGLNTLTRPQKQALVGDLYRHGAFGGRSSADYVARILGMGRATVFKYVKALREESREPDRPRSGRRTLIRGR